MSGNPRIVYRDSDTNDLRYAAWNGASWDIESVGSLSGTYGSVWLALTAAGEPHATYQGSDVMHAVTAGPLPVRWAQD